MTTQQITCEYPEGIVLVGTTHTENMLDGEEIFHWQEYKFLKKPTIII